MNIYNKASDVIKDLNRILLHLEEHLVKELDTHQRRQAAGWLADEIREKLNQIREICQKQN